VRPSRGGFFTGIASISDRTRTDVDAGNQTHDDSLRDVLGGKHEKAPAYRTSCGAESVAASASSDTSI
jgi:hypothetical protein